MPFVYKQRQAYNNLMDCNGTLIYFSEGMHRLNGTIFAALHIKRVPRSRSQ